MVSWAHITQHRDFTGVEIEKGLSRNGKSDLLNDKKSEKLWLSLYHEIGIPCQKKKWSVLTFSISLDRHPHTYSLSLSIYLLFIINKNLGSTTTKHPGRRSKTKSLRLTTKSRRVWDYRRTEGDLNTTKLHLHSQSIIYKGTGSLMFPHTLRHPIFTHFHYFQFNVTFSGTVDFKKSNKRVLSFKGKHTKGVCRGGVSCSPDIIDLGPQNFIY